MSRPALVLLHGWGMHGGIWGEFAIRLSQDFELHCPDLPGYGGTDPVSPCDVPAMARALLPGLPEKAFCLGWSLGGMVAMELAATYPGRVEKLLLVGSSPRFCREDDWPDAMAPAILDAFAAQMRGHAAATLNRFLAIQALGGEDARAQTALLKRLIAERPLPTEETLRDGLAILRHGDLRALLPAITQPVCLIQGEQDTVVPPGTARALARLLKAAELHLLPGCAHAPFLTRPAEVAALVSRFLQS